jgi:hypothetical protein
VKHKRLRAVAIAASLAVAALVAGRVAAPADAASFTDAAFTDAEYANGSLKATSLPTVSFIAPTTQNGTTLTFHWKYNATPLPGQTVTFTAGTTGIVILGTYTLNPVTTAGTTGTNTGTLTIGGLPTGTGSYVVSATTKVGTNWSAAATNQATWPVTLCVGGCIWGTFSP